MKRRQYIRSAGAAAIGGALAGCVASGSNEPTDPEERTKGTDDGNDGGSETGTLATSVTDRPVDIDDFESCVITVEGIWVKPDDAGPDDGSEGDREGSAEELPTPEDDGGASEAGDGAGDVGTGNPEEGVETEGGDQTGTPEETEESGENEGRRYIGFDEPREADLVRLQGANTQLIDETELAVGEYRYLQLDVSGVEGVLVNGGEAGIGMPGNAPLQFKHPFEIRADERTRFVADFAPVRRGQGDQYLLRPIARGTQVLYGDEEYAPDADESGRNAENEKGEGSVGGEGDADGKPE